MATTSGDVQAAAIRYAQLSREPIKAKATEAELQARKDLAHEKIVRTKAQRLITQGLALLESLDGPKSS